MNKRLIVLAVAAAACAPAAMADDSTVTLYGTLNADFENVKADGCTSNAAGTACAVNSNQPRRNRVSSNSSNLGFRGSEDLGGGLRAVFQLESGINLDTGQSSATFATPASGTTIVQTGQAGAGTWGSRNSKIGLAGGFGEIFLGTWDTPYKTSSSLAGPNAGGADAFYGTGIAYYANVLSGNSTPTSKNTFNRNGFDRRQNNQVQYITPNLSGFSGRIAYSANEEKTADAAAAVSSPGVPAIPSDPSLWSASATFATGPVYVSLAYERHDEYGNVTTLLPTVSTVKTKDDAWKITGTYTLFGNTTIGLIAERLKFKGALATSGLPKIVTLGTTTLANEARVDAFYLSVVHRMGPHAIRADYGADRGVKLSGGDAGTSDGSTKARTWGLGYSFSFSKRTDLYALYTEIKNDNNSRNDFSINGVGSVAQGADPKGFGVGMRTTF